MTVAVNAATLAILWFGSQALGRGEIEIGHISALITYLTQILISVNMIANVFMQSSRSIKKFTVPKWMAEIWMR